MAYAAMPELRGGISMGGTKRPSGDARRELEFRRARRHSNTVRLLKVVLPLMAAGLISLYAVPSFMRKSIDHGRGTATVRGVTLEAGALKMIEPSVKGVNERGEVYDFTANSATQAAKNADILYLDVVRGKMTGLDGKVSTLTAPNGVHNSKSEEMTFNNGAVVTRDGGMSATFETATASMKQQTVISKTPVVVRLHESTIHAETMTLYWGAQRAIFGGHVRTHLERQPEGTPSSQIAVSLELGAANAVPGK